jgi:hypothetical protein
MVARGKDKTEENEAITWAKAGLKVLRDVTQNRSIMSITCFKQKYPQMLNPNMFKRIVASIPPEWKHEIRPPKPLEMGDWIAMRERTTCGRITALHHGKAIIDVYTLDNAGDLTPMDATMEIYTKHTTKAIVRYADDVKQTNPSWTAWSGTNPPIDTRLVTRPFQPTLTDRAPANA